MDSNRIFLLAFVLICCSSGVVALVSSSDEVSKTPILLSFPEPLVKVKGYDVPEKKILLVRTKEPVIEETVAEAEEV